MAINGFKLSFEETAKLRALQDDIDTLTADVERLEKVGIKTANLKAQLKAAKTLKDNLLKEFASD